MEAVLQFLDKLLEIAFGGLLAHNIKHFLADGTNLTSLSIARGLGLLVSLLLGETNAKDTKLIAIGSSHINECFDKSLPLSDQGAEFVTGHIHAVEVSKDIKSVNILTDKLDLSVSLALISTVQVCERDLEHTALQAFGCNFYKKITFSSQRVQIMKLYFAQLSW